MVSLASSSQNFISQVCEAFRKAVERASGVTLEGREREFRRVLARYLFDEVLGWERYSKVGEIYDIACFDDEDFPIIIVETKYGVKLTHEIKEKLRRRIEELGSVKYGVFASEREFIVYEFRDYELREVTKVNVAEAIGVAKQEFGLSEVGRRRILKLESLKRERLVWVEEPEYFEETYKEISVAKREGVKLLTNNLKAIVSNLSTVLMNFFHEYEKRKDHYTGKFLENTFNDWLRISMKDEEFKRAIKKGDEKRKGKIIEVFCRETAYVLLGRVLFTRICEDKGIIEPIISGRGITESLIYYGKRRKENLFLRLFNDTREEIKKYYSHLHELGFFDWWVIEETRKNTLVYDDRMIQENLEKDLDYYIKKAFRRLNRFDFTEVNRDILGDVYQGYLPPEERKRLGEFYTPPEVIEYILDAVGYKPENEIRAKKLLDPACGSGSFLVEATQRLIECYRRIGFNLRDADDARQIIDGCINSIYGLDIHPFACFIAEMNLLFQFVDLYDVVRQRNKYYKLPRLNVYRTDSLMPAGTTVIELVEFVNNSRRRMLIEETKGADRVKNLVFDFVVGNPPYVNYYRLVNSWGEEYTKKLCEIYETPTKKFDILVPFVEMGLRILKEGGSFGYIVSGGILNPYAEKLRSMILEYKLDEIVDLRNCKDLFVKSKYIYLILIIKKRTIHDTYNIKISENITSKSQLLTKDFDIKYLPQTVFKEHYRKEFRIEIKPPFLPIIEKIRHNSAFLKELCYISRGMTVGDEKKFIADRKIDAGHVKILYQGEEVGRYTINWNGKYLRWKPKEIKKSGGSGLKPPAAFSLQKILVRQVTEGGMIIATYDDKGFFHTADMYMVVPWCVLCDLPSNITSRLKGFGEVKNRQIPEVSSLYVLGLLNSKLIAFYANQYLSEKFHMYPDPLKYVPIKISENPKEIVRRVESILEINKQTSFIKEKISGFPYTYFENGWSFDKLINVVKAKSLTQPSYAISEGYPRTDYLLKDLDGKETFRIILALDEYIDFYTEHIASFVFEVLKTVNKITKRELLELKIPSKEYLRTLMAQYQKDKEQIVKNERIIEDLEKQIDDLVYKLYNITHKERTIIEEYLAKF